MLFNSRAYKKKSKAYFDEIADDYDEGLSAILMAIHTKLLDEARLEPGHKVLNVGCGTGMDSFLAAEEVGPEGSVVGIDISAGMIARANAKAEARGLTNVTSKVMDAEKLDFPNESFDSVISHLALNFFPDDHKALREMRRVLKPGGQVAICVVGRPENSPFMLTPFRVVAKRLPRVAFTEGGPATFRHSPEGALEAAISGAKFVETWSGRYSLMVTVKDADTYWELFRKWAASFTYRFSREDEATQASLVDEIKEAVSRHATDDGIRLPIEMVLGVGHKPSGKEARGPKAREVKTYSKLVDESREEVRAADLARAKEALEHKVLFDVRQHEEFARAHIAGAQHVPRGMIEEVVASDFPDTRLPIVCYCDDEERSILAAKALAGLGYAEASYLGGGLEGWQREGGETTSDEEAR